MPRKSNIKWRDNDLAELRRVVKNYNAKLARQRTKLIEADERYQASQLPRKASVKELRQSIETRKDFNSELREMQNFIDTGNKFTVDKNTNKSLHATVRDFNIKLDRLYSKAKTQGERASLPERISSEDLLKNASSKTELKKQLQMFKGFLKRGAEEVVELPDSKHNIKLTKWQFETMEQLKDIINKNRQIELEEWRKTQVKYGGKEAGYQQGQARMDQGDFDEFQPIKTYNFSSTYSDMREKFRMMMRESQEGYWDARTELARINYTEKLDKIMGDHPIGKILLKKIKSLPLDDFKRTLKGEDDLFLLLYQLEREPDNYDVLLEEIWNEWYPDADMYEVLDDYISKMGG